MTNLHDDEYKLLEEKKAIEKSWEEVKTKQSIFHKQIADFVVQKKALQKEIAGLDHQIAILKQSKNEIDQAVIKAESAKVQINAGLKQVSNRYWSEKEHIT